MSGKELTKRCTKCKQIKSHSEFTKDRRNKDGYQSYCKQCHYQYGKLYQQQYNKQYYRAHRTQELQRQKQYCKTLKGYLRVVWRSMLYRCNNPNNKRYNCYGGRGIKVKFACFEDFYDYVVKELKADPRGLTIDRIDNNGHYEKGNIRFVTRKENIRSKQRKGV